MILDDLADYLSTQGRGIASTSTGGVITIFKGIVPAIPTTPLTAILEYGGAPYDRAMSTGPGLAIAENPRVQIERRDLDYQAARTEMNAIVKVLDGAHDLTINGVAYFSIVALQPPFALPYDQNQRARIVCNFEAKKALT